MPPVGFEPTISAGERPQTYALDRVATGTGCIPLGYVYTPRAPGYNSYLVSKTFKTNETPIFKINNYFILLKYLQIWFRLISANILTILLIDMYRKRIVKVKYIVKFGARGGTVG